MREGVDAAMSYRGSGGTWRSFTVLGAGTGMRHGRTLLLNSLSKQTRHKWSIQTIVTVLKQKKQFIYNIGYSTTPPPASYTGHD